MDLEHREQDYNGTVLTTAARAGQLELVRLLLSQGVQPRQPGDEDWSTPAFWAVRNGHAEITKLLAED